MTAKYNVRNVPNIISGYSVLKKFRFINIIAKYYNHIRYSYRIIKNTFVLVYVLVHVYVTLRAEFYRMSTFHKIIFIESRLPIWNVDFL